MYKITCANIKFENNDFAIKRRNEIFGQFFFLRT